MERFKYIGAAYFILINDDKVLLLKRKNTGYMDGKYGFPSGHLEGNETVREGGSREIKEEIGLNILPVDLNVVHIMHRKADKDERFDFFLTANKYEGEIINCEPDKCEELKWFSLNNLPENIIPYISFALEKYKNNILYSEFGF